MGLKGKYSRLQYEAGTDEAGRGCLAGPVTAAAVILPEDFKHPHLNDSKQLSKKKREELRVIIEQEAITFAVIHTPPAVIDEINILKASIKSMHDALAQLSTPPEFIAVDGNKFTPFGDVPHACIVKGDGKYLNIAAASVLAKPIGMNIWRASAWNIRNTNGIKTKDTPPGSTGKRFLNSGLLPITENLSA